MTPRDYQAHAIDRVWDYFIHNTGNPVVAMPTGTGKSVVIGGFMHRAFDAFPQMSALMLTHVKELIQQNADRLLDMWPQAPLGIHSAGLKRRDVHFPIIYGGIQSIMPYVQQIGYRNLLLIDECHLLSPEGDTLYRKLITALLAFNPKLKVVGFSATPWRMRQGHITEGGIFTDVCFDATTIEWFDWFFHNGYLVPPIPKRTQTELDTSNVGINNGEFALNQLQAAVDKDEITIAALQELVANGQDRRAWLIFASGIEHAEHIAEALTRYFGVPAAAVHSKITADERDDRLKAFKSGQLRCVVNNNVLTTGFDHPPIDLIGMMRPTLSTGLWVQMIGRGMRPFEEFGWRKSNCLVLDFARNTERLGPINDPRIPRKSQPGGGDAPVKICEHCGTYNHTRVRFCEGCGQEFVFQPQITKLPSALEIIRSNAPQFEWYNVSRVFYDYHQKKDYKTKQPLPGHPPVLRVRYVSGARQFSEWIALEAHNFAGHKARNWWRRRHYAEPPETVAEALKHVSELQVPRRIQVWVNKDNPEVMDVEF